jgi:phospholipid/cholesterol/gamma-HCH transport system substrate-binding protein
MSKRPMRDLSVGALAALALLVLGVTIMSVGGQSRLFSSKAHFRVVFPNTEGLRVGSPVKIAGVQVGTVTEVHLPTDPTASGIEAELGIESAYAMRVREGSLAELKYLQWLSGEKYVEVSPGDSSRAVLAEGSVIPVASGQAFLQKGADIAENLNDITISLKGILTPLQEGKGLLGQAIQDPEFGTESLAHLKATLDNLEAITGRIRKGESFAGKWLSDPAMAGSAGELSKAIHDLSSILDAIARREGAIGALIAEGGTGEQAVSDLRDAAASLRRIAEKLESKDGLFGKLLNDTEYSSAIAADLKATLRNLSEITGKVNSGQGTLGALVNERVLYDGMEDVVAGTNDSKFARWLMRHYQKKGIEESEEAQEKEEAGKKAPSP